MSIEISKFGYTKNNEEVTKYTLTNKNGLKVSIINYGGVIISIMTPDKNGNFTDIVCGYDTIEEYEKGDQHQGELVGRFANRISKGKFVLNGKEYILAKNDGNNHLHGGNIGYGARVWSALPKEENGKDVLELNIDSPDGEEGYPGNLHLKVVYTFDDENKLSIAYEAVSDKDTVCNFTNHAYFNLCGYASCDVKNHRMRIAADYITETDDELIPTGKLLPVDSTMYDLRIEREIDGEYDDNFVINPDGKDSDTAKEVCSVYEPQSGRRINVYTTLPGMQLYTGNMMQGGIPFKGGVESKNHTAFCLETQRWPDSPNHENFSDCTLRANEVFKSLTIYEFTI